MIYLSSVHAIPKSLELLWLNHLLTSVVPVECETLKSGRVDDGRRMTSDAGRIDMKVEIFKACT